MLSPDHLATGVAWVHFTFAAFVVLGLAFIVAGAVWRWEWVRNFWFRFLHLGAIAFEVARLWLGLACPLTVLEHRLRAAPAGMASAGSTALHLAHVGVFAGAPRVPFMIGTTAFFGLVLIAYISYGPRPDN